MTALMCAIFPDDVVIGRADAHFPENKIPLAAFLFLCLNPTDDGSMETYRHGGVDVRYLSRRCCGWFVEEGRMYTFPKTKSRLQHFCSCASIRAMKVAV